MPDDADIFRELAPMLRVRPELQAICRFGAQRAFGHELEGCRWAPFHIVTLGGCLLDAGDRIGIRLTRGMSLWFRTRARAPFGLYPTAGGPASVLRVYRRLQVVVKTPPVISHTENDRYRSPGVEPDRPFSVGRKDGLEGMVSILRFSTLAFWTNSISLVRPRWPGAS